jgi:hypothetical protein
MSKKFTVEQANHFLQASGLVLISMEDLHAIGELAKRLGFYEELKALDVVYHEGFDTLEIDNDSNEPEG